VHCGNFKVVSVILSASFNSITAERIAIKFGIGGVRLPGGTGNFSLYHRVQNGSWVHPASYSMDTRGSFPGGKADHSPQCSAEVKK
jgi:hypothetical protein